MPNCPISVPDLTDALVSEWKQVLAAMFPTSSVLDCGGVEFEDGEEVYDAIGGLLQGSSADCKNEDDIRDICQQINGHAASKQVLLDTPVQLSQISAECGKSAGDLGLTVDARKLEKAEAKLKQKQGRRNERDSQKTTSPLVLEEASASQASSKKDSRVDLSGKNRTYDIRIENFDVSFGERSLLQAAELSLSTGRRYGLIGRNGLGKTTLLKMLASRSLRVPAHITILHVEQEVAGDDTGALQSVLESDTVREGLLTEERLLNARIANGTAEGMETVRLSEIYAKLEEIEADKAPARASIILCGLGFSPKMQTLTTKEFSGGWRMRLALARALFTWQTTILVVSHDRNFLNAVVTDIIHLHSQRLESYRGDYENFVKTKEDRLKNQQREYEAQFQYREHIQVFIDRFRYNANRAAQVQSKLKLLEKLPELKPLEKETEVTLKFPDNFEKLSPPVLQLDEVEFYYNTDQRLFTQLSVSADLESRICIVGENGAGKSTMLKLLMGELTPVNGIRHAHRNLKIGYFSQHHVDQLDLNVCSIELLLNKFPGRNEEEYRHQLGGYGITGELATRPVASLSGGQKSRVAFAQMTMPCPNFYILDEPTNHLDMETIEALAKALNKFKGGVVLVSHDERLIRLVCRELWVCEHGNVRRVEGGFDEYRDILQEQFRKEGYL
uniref:ABC transporter domain-containing protein n=1 Tax=Oncorhynchus mykiss TaxID=8022 RepID=A0A8C7UQP5_ONCMY